MVPESILNPQRCNIAIVISASTVRYRYRTKYLTQLISAIMIVYSILGYGNMDHDGASRLYARLIYGL